MALEFTDGRNKAVQREEPCTGSHSPGIGQNRRSVGKEGILGGLGIMGLDCMAVMLPSI